MRSVRYGAAFLAVTLVVAISSVAFAQLTTTGELAGTVTDHEGKPVHHAKVTVKGPQGEKKVETDKDGSYLVQFLPVGTYKVTVGGEGQIETKVESVDVRLGSRTRQDVKMPSPTVTETVVVTAEAPTVDTTRTDLTTSIDHDLFEKVPVGRSIADVTKLSVGVGTSAGGNGNSPGDDNPAIGGASGLENTYLVDGVNIGNTGYGAIGSYSIKYGSFGSGVNFDFIDTVQVKTGGFEAEYGQALGGIVNVLTKSGSNDFHGAVFGYWEPESLRGDRKFPKLESQGVVETTSETKYDMGFQVGGPIVKDKFFFFAAYDPQWRTQKRRAPEGYELRSLGDVSTDTTRNAYAGKLSWNPTTRQTVELSLFGDPGKNDYGPQFNGALLNPEPNAFSSIDFGSNSQTIHYQAVPTDHLTVEAKIGHTVNIFRESFPPQNDQYRLQDYTGPTTKVSGGIGFYEADTRGENTQFEGKATAFFDALGSHELKFGGIWEDIAYDSANNYTGAPGVQFYDQYGNLYTYRSGVRVQLRCESKDANGNCINPYYRLVRGFLNDPVQDTTASYYALFVQDKWTPTSTLTIDLGLRAEGEKLEGGGSGFTTPDGTVVKPGGYTFKIKDHIAPRLGASWDFTGDGKGKVYAHAGRFFQKVPNDMAVRQFSAEYDAIFVYYRYIPGLPLRDNLNPAYQTFDYGNPDLFGSTTQVLDGTKLSYEDEFVLGSEYELMRNLNVGVRYTHRNMGRVLEDFAEVPAETITAGLADFGYYVIGNPGKRLNNTCPPDHPNCWVDPKRTYDALEFTAEKRLADHWQALGSYRWSHLRGNYEGFFRSDNGQSDPSLTSLFDFPNNTTYSTAELDALCGTADDYQACVAGLPPAMFNQGKVSDLPLDRRHNFQLAGSYTWGSGLTMGASSHIQSGAPERPLYAHPAYANSGEIPVGSLGRTPWTWTLDLHADYPIKLKKHTWLMFIADVFNATNNRKTIAVDTNKELTIGEPDPDFGKSLDFQDPRAIRLGVKFGF